MARFTITLPDDVASKLAADEERLKTPRSTLIAQHLERHYTQKSADEYEADIQKVRADTADIVQRVKNEHEKRVQRLVSDHEAEVQRFRAECEKQVERINEDRSVSIQQLEDSLEELENVTEKLQLEKSSKEVVVTGMRHEVELLQQKVANLETLLHTERGLTSELRRDKETLQKQLELVTLRLPTPKLGFWSRIFGGGRKKED